MNANTFTLPDWEMNVFKITGTNPATNRRKSVEVVIVGNNEEAAKQKSGLLNVISAELINQEPPSRAQIDYGNDLGIEYKSSYTKRDYSCLISIAAEEEDYYPIDARAAEMAAERNIYLSRYASLSRLYRVYYGDLDVKETAAFYAFTLFQSFNGIECYDYKKHSKHDLFEQFAEENINNDAFTRSLLKIKDSNQFMPEYGTLSQTTNAFKICFDFFFEKDLVPPIGKSDTVTDSKPEPVNTQPTETAPVSRTAAPKPSLICDNCGKANPKNAVYCSECHSMLYQNVVCPKCHTENNHNNVLCQKCKYQLKPVETAENAEKNSGKGVLIGGIIATAIIAALILIFLFSCNNNPAKKQVSESTSAQQITGQAGLTENDVETFFYRNVSDASLVTCSIKSNGSYSLDFTLSKSKSEWENNFDDFALSIQTAIDKFSKTHCADAHIFAIIFYSDEYSRIYWMSFDQGKTGTLTETHGDNYKNEKTISFDELVEYYAKKK